MALDPGMEESTVMDGAPYTTILAKIIAPLSKPVVATIGLWTAVAHWNAWFDSLIYIRDPNKRVLQLILHKMMNLLRNFYEFEEFNTQLEIPISGIGSGSCGPSNNWTDYTRLSFRSTIFRQRYHAWRLQVKEKKEGGDGKLGFQILGERR